ncbi:MAG: thioredoxin family protein [Gemmatimonadota bacterium]|nr:thioredoxin family protein [Gemmatimonadota bacterium]
MTQSTRSQWSLATLLLVGSVAAGAFAIVRAAPGERERTPAPAEIPWSQLDLRGRTAVASGAPLAILYVQRRCPQCRRTAQIVDSLGGALGIATFLVTNDSPSVAEIYARDLRLRQPVVRDTARAFARLFRIGYVPTLITFNGAGRGARHLGSASAATFRSLLEGVR